jgi:hypothetical protein
MAKNTVILLLVLVLVCIAMQVSSADQHVNVAATHGITGGLGLSGLVRSVTGITGLLGEKPAETSSKKVSGSNN